MKVRQIVLAVLMVGVTLPSVSYAQHKITITRVESLRPVPSGKVARDTLDPIPGTSIALSGGKPMLQLPKVDQVLQRFRSVPLPTPNPLGVSFCDVDIYPFEE